MSPGSIVRTSKTWAALSAGPSRSVALGGRTDFEPIIVVQVSGLCDVVAAFCVRSFVFVVVVGVGVPWGWPVGQGRGAELGPF